MIVDIVLLRTMNTNTLLMDTILHSYNLLETAVLMRSANLLLGPVLADRLAWVLSLLGDSVSVNLYHNCILLIRMAQINSPFDLSKCARPNILALVPYRCARELVCWTLLQTWADGAVTTKMMGGTYCLMPMKILMDLA